MPVTELRVVESAGLLRWQLELHLGLLQTSRGKFMIAAKLNSTINLKVNEKTSSFAAIQLHSFPCFCRATTRQALLPLPCF